jgi:hypothetical protein
VGAIRHRDGELDIWHEALPGSFWIFQASDDLLRWVNLSQPIPSPHSMLSNLLLAAPKDDHLYYRAVSVD